MGPELLIPIFAIVGVFSSTIVFVYMFFSSRHKERMALLETGKDASVFYNEGIRNSLKFGFVAVMVGLGVLMGHLLERSGMPEEVAYFSMILILGGLGLITYYFYINKTKETERTKEMV